MSGPPRGPESLFRLRTDIRITRIRRCADLVQHKPSDQIRLIKHVHVGVRGQIAAVADEPEAWIKAQFPARVSPILNELVLLDRGHEVSAATAHGQERPLCWLRG